MALFRIAEVNITPAAGLQWQDADLSAYIPEGATGVLIRMKVTTAFANYYAGVRPNGSTSVATHPTHLAGLVYYQAVGVDANRIVECFKTASNYCTYYLEGYFTDDAYFFTNMPTYSSTATNAWTDLDVSGNVPAGAVGVTLGVIYNGAAQWAIGFRKNGSSDNRTKNAYYGSGGINVGIDANRVFEYYTGMVYNNTLWLFGYFLSPAGFLTNGVAICSDPSTTGWKDADAQSGKSAIAIEDLVSYAYPRAWGARMNGSSDAVQSSYYHFHCWAVAGADASGVAECYIGELSVHTYYKLGTFVDTSAVPGAGDDLLMAIV